MTSEETYLNYTFSKFTLKYYSMLSIRSEQESKISSNRCSSQETPEGGSSPFNKNKWVICEWPICKRKRAVSSRLVKQRDGRRSVKFGKILCNIFLGYSSHSLCQSSKIIYYSYSYSDVVCIAIKGILSSRICCRITSDANMARNPDKSNRPFLLD